MLEIKTVTNRPLAGKLQRVCRDTLPWLISFSLDGVMPEPEGHLILGFTKRSLSRHYLALCQSDLDLQQRFADSLRQRLFSQPIGLSSRLRVAPDVLARD